MSGIQVMAELGACKDYAYRRASSRCRASSGHKTNSFFTAGPAYSRQTLLEVAPYLSYLFDK
jgi:hypothetical protein